MQQPAQTTPHRPQRPPSWADAQLAALRHRHPDWEFWHIPTPHDPGSGYRWCAKPAGAAAVTCQGDTPADLEQAITEFEADVAATIETARRMLENTPDHPAAALRNMLETQLAALTRLHIRLHTRRQDPAAPQAAQ